MKNTEKLHKIRITEEMIPKTTDGDGRTMVRVVVDERQASCFLDDQRFSPSPKIVIVFDKLHPRWGEYFTTKYFRFEEPGKMQWGHQGENMSIDALLMTKEIE